MGAWPLNPPSGALFAGFTLHFASIPSLILPRPINYSVQQYYSPLFERLEIRGNYLDFFGFVNRQPYAS
jgi:hypothetical protein